jgi:NDP-sugar pyrophosphorylase family protein
MDNILDLNHTITAPLFSGVAAPWEVLPKISNFFKTFNTDGYTQIKDGVWVGRDVMIDEFVKIVGPAIIGHSSSIRHGAYIRENVIIGENCVVGNSCEVKNAILFDQVQVAHFNYVGDSVLGFKCHMGAGAICSNVRGDKKEISVSKKPTGLRKFGVIMGDHGEIGCNSVLFPGCVLGKHVQVYPLTPVRGVIPAHTIVKTDGTMISKKEES